MLTNTILTLIGYFIGAIPFGYLIFRAVKGIDIRTVGSGNIGATNVGRNLGFRYFLLVFALDLLKGFLPTWGFPAGLRWMGAEPGPALPVLLALATILGHSFPVYLGFKGGKGVATSLGALLALDPAACAAAAVGFFVIFALTRFVSLSSIAGALSFVAAQLVRVANPWSTENRPMTLLALGIAVLLILRHRKNLGRIIAGTEPRVPLRRSRPDQSVSGEPSGKVQSALVLAIAIGSLVVAGPAIWVARRAAAPVEAVAGPWSLHETHRVLTGQQRSSRILFADEGRTLAVMCPRYNRVLVYRVSSQNSLEPTAEIELQGRPVAIAASRNRLIALQRPPGDDKHLGPGWWQAFSFNGKPVGGQVAVGYYPDDCACSPDGTSLFVLSSGRAEGDAHKPLPALEVFSLGMIGAEPPVEPTVQSRLTFDPADDPERLVISALGSRGLVVLKRGNRALALDLGNLESLRLAGQVQLTPAEPPHPSISDDGDWIIIPASSETEAVGMPWPAAMPRDAQSSAAISHVAFLRPDDSAIEVLEARVPRTAGLFPIRGPLNLGGTRPSGLAFSPERRLLAVATKPGTVHLIAVRSRLDEKPDRNLLAETTRTR